jgi:hypothetical protein
MDGLSLAGRSFRAIGSASRGARFAAAGCRFVTVFLATVLVVALGTASSPCGPAETYTVSVVCRTSRRLRLQIIKSSSILRTGENDVASRLCRW